MVITTLAGGFLLLPEGIYSAESGACDKHFGGDTQGQRVYWFSSTKFIQIRFTMLYIISFRLYKST